VKVTLGNRAAKEFVRLNEPLKGRIKAAIDGLGKEPPEGDIKPLAGSDAYRVRVGDFRIVFAINSEGVRVHKIEPRGQVYKGMRRLPWK
jgi:mRNA interferase RelE/StbE